MLKTLSEIPCSFCGGAGLEGQSETEAACRFCGTTNTLEGLLCPRCEAVNARAAETCARCGNSLFRKCPRCEARNWVGQETCAECGQALDTLAVLAERAQLDTASRLDRQQRESGSIKAQEARAAEGRMARLVEADQRRQQALAEANTRRVAQERRMMIGVAVFVAAMSLVVVAALFVAVFSR